MVPSVLGQQVFLFPEGNKLYAIYPNVGRIPHCKNVSRHNAVVIIRLRIGHTRLMHLHLLTGEDLLTCQFCSLPLTVNHILLECANLNTIQQRFFSVSSLRDLFDSIDNHVCVCVYENWIRFSIIMWRVFWWKLLQKEVSVSFFGRNWQKPELQFARWTFV